MLFKFNYWLTMKKLIMVSSLFVCTSFALTASSKALKADTLKTQALQEVQVLSTRSGKTAPMAVSNMTKQQLEKLNMGQDMPYLLSLTPSVTTTSDAGNGIGYTSFRVRGTDPSRINITVNGIPMNDAESSQVYWVNTGDLASSVQTIQIQRGIGTSTNGAGAFGATLNMQTDNIGIKPFVGLDVAAGSYRSHKESLRFGTGLLGNHWGFQGRLSNIGSDGYIDRASTKLNSYFLQGGYFGDNTMIKFVTFNGIEQTYHAWNYTSKYEQQQYGRTYNSCGEYYDEQGNRHYYPNQYDNYHQQHYQLLFDQLLGTTWSLNAALHYTRGSGYYEEYKTKRTWAEYNLTNDWEMTGDLVRQKKMENDFYGVIAGLNFDNKRNIKATLGGAWNKYHGDHFGKVIWTSRPYHLIKDATGHKTKQYLTAPEVLPDHEYYRNKALKTDFNVYGKVSWTVLNGLSMFADLQYRNVNYKMTGPSDAWEYGAQNTQAAFDLNNTFHFFNPKFGLNYAISNRHRVYASYAIAHKEPTRNDYEDNLSASIKAERMGDLEVGYKFSAPKFTAGVNLYWMDYANQFVLTGALNEIGEMIASNQNAGKSYRIGAEIEAAWQPVSWFRWDFNATFSRNRAKDWTVTLDDKTNVSLGETPLSFSPEAILNSIFTFNYRGLSASLSSQYISSQYLTNSGFKSYATTDDEGKPIEVGMMLQSHFVTNLNVDYRLPKFLGIKECVVGLTVYNLFSAKFDNNGWAAPSFKKDAAGKVVAYTDADQYEAGFAPSAPINFMAHLSLNF